MQCQRYGFVAFVFVLLAGCSGSSDNTDVMNGPDTGINLDAPGAIPVFLDANGRLIAIDILEINDVLLFLKNRVASLVVNASTDTLPSCGAGTAILNADNGSLILENCSISESDPTEVSGRLTAVDGDENGEFSIENSELLLRNLTRTVTINGEVQLSQQSDGDMLEAEYLSVEDGINIYSLSEFSLQQTAVSKVSVTYRVVFEAIGVELAVATIAPLQLAEASRCFTEGQLTVAADDGSELSIGGGGGDNLTYSFRNGSDTLACSEIRSLFLLNAPPLLPPRAPGAPAR